MLKKLIILSLAFAPLAAFAQDKLAYINSQEIYYQMPEIGGVESKITAKQEEIRKTLTGLETEYTRKQEEFRADTASLTQSVLLDRQKQLEQLQERYETYAQNSQKELQELSQQLQAPLFEKLQKAIQEVGQEQGYTYIFEKNVAPYISSSAVDASKFVKPKLGIK
ncbi:OmpH family outer membrane protein [Dysgonomonas sp. 520]|uniref:OmpH family outer membrane protein n=1 Tax=Dysgonomonas sp. 520 TaxID=2302931 RepID=UPI0013D045AC|nr:OmpH family outer membrane protein [Dysgonomonas sp. 520]NDW08778.1 OmpH family outer membrane protein [Dysgonomonas sp. 520]